MGEVVKVHLIKLMVIDFDDLGADGVETELENARFPNDCVSPRVIDIETRDIGEWTDDHPLNKTATIVPTLRALFAPTP